MLRTVAGFHDVYVAAPSRKAALAAWGTTKDLFAKEAAEEVTDPELMAEPLERPGEVIQRARGTLAEQLKAAGPKIAAPGKSKARPRPMPSRAALDKAEAAVDAFERKAADELADLRVRQEALARKASGLEARHRQERDRLKQRRAKQAEKYRERLNKRKGAGTDSAVPG